MLIYGSYAMKHWFDDFPREPKDIDIVSLDKNDYDLDLINRLRETDLELEINHAPFFNCLVPLSVDNIMTADAMLNVRMSHAMYDIHWHKAIHDIIFLQDKGATHDIDIINELRNGWKIVHAGVREKMDLKQSADKFFNSNIKRIINHDELHEKLKLTEVPAYKKILQNNITVEVSKDKFDDLSYDEKLSTVLEECLVLACERYYYLQNPRHAYMLALKDFTTRMTSGWYNIFLLENIKFFTTFNNPIIWDKVNTIMQEIITEESKIKT